MGFAGTASGAQEEINKNGINDVYWKKEKNQAPMTN
jgi:hypothetical protein